MKTQINIAELLKDCPKGMELDCTMYDNVTFERFDVEQNRCYFKAGPADTFWTTCYGKINGSPFGKCVIFPKGKTTWEGFQRPFMDGDIVVCTNGSCTFTAIFKGMRNGSSFYRYGVMYDNEFRCLVNDWSDFNDSCRLATEEEKAKLFDAIKANGYKWNPETKTLEKLEQPKFDITTLKPFDKVLVRDNNEQFWTCDWFSFHDTKQVYPFACVGHYVSQCIPYEENQHLLGTTNDCDNFYKTWE